MGEKDFFARVFYSNALYVQLDLGCFQSYAGYNGGLISKYLRSPQCVAVEFYRNLYVLDPIFPLMIITVKQFKGKK